MAVMMVKAQFEEVRDLIEREFSPLRVGYSYMKYHAPLADGSGTVWIIEIGCGEEVERALERAGISYKYC